jgi:subtilisin family serine protease
MLRAIALSGALGLGLSSNAICRAHEEGGHRVCQPLSCSTLIPRANQDDARVNDCAYRAGNQWWLDYIAGSLAWASAPAPTPITVALFDDGADTGHVDLRNQLWVNAAEAEGRAGEDDDDNGLVDDLHGWDFVDDDPIVSPEGVCGGRAQHGTFMASLIAAERNNRAGIAAAGADGARVMILRVVGCGRDHRDRADPDRLVRALRYATRMDARILNFSAHWNTSTPELDAAFAEVADRPDSDRAALVVASVPNKGEPTAGYPAAYRFRRIIRAVPIGNDDAISPGISATLPGANLGAPSACVLGATRAPASFGVSHGSSNSTAILAGLLAGIWARPEHARLSPDEFFSRVIEGEMLRTSRRSRPGFRPPFLDGVPLADGCLLAGEGRSASVCTQASPTRP